MVIGQFLSHYPGPGGSSSVLRGLSSGLIELGHEAVIYGFGPSGQPPLDGARERIFPPPRISQRGVAALPWPTDELTRVLSTNDDNLDVLIVHGMFSPFSMRIARAARAGGIATIAQPHDPYSAPVFAERRLAKSLYWRFFERGFLRSVDAVQLYAPSHREHLIRLGVDTRPLVVPAALTPRALEQAARARQAHTSADRNAVLLLFVGRFDVYNKGLDLLLEAIAATPALRSSIQLECVGARDEHELAPVAEIVRRLDLRDSVKLSYRQTDPWAAFANADLFVLPSRFDGFALVALEALSAGTPVVISSAAGASEYLCGDPSVVISHPSVDGLQTALLDALSRLDALRAAASEAHSRIDLTWRRCAEIWLNGVSDLELVAPHPKSAMVRT